MSYAVAEYFSSNMINAASQGKNFLAELGNL